MDDAGKQPESTDERLDAALRKKLRDLPAPRGLAEQIVSGYPQTRIGPRFKAWPLALAASVAFLASALLLLWLTSQPKGELAEFRAEMARELRSFPQLEVYSERSGELLSWLRKKEGFSSAAIPAALRKFPSIGCREVSWRGKRGALLCFMAEGEVIHLFVFQADSWRDLDPSFAASRGYRSAAWRENDVAFVALSRGSEALLRNALGWAPRG